MGLEGGGTEKEEKEEEEKIPLRSSIPSGPLLKKNKKGLFPLLYEQNASKTLVSPRTDRQRLVAQLIPPSVSPSVTSIRYRLFWYLFSKVKSVVSKGSKEGGERRRIRER